MRRCAQLLVAALSCVMALATPQTPAAAQSPASATATATATAKPPAPALPAFADVDLSLEGLNVSARVAPRAGAAKDAPFEVGTPIAYRLIFSGDARASVSIDVGRTIGDFDVLSLRGPTAASDGTSVADLVVMTLESGTVAPPPITVRWAIAGVAKSASIALPAIEVKSLLGETIDPARFRDIAGEVALAEDAASRSRVLVPALAALALVAVAAFVAWRLLRGVRREIPPDAWAREALADLERKGLPARGDFAIFYDRLTEIVRGYVVRRFGIPAERQTSREFLAAASGVAAFPAAERDRLRDLLRLADLVKFASARPDVAECDAHLADARAFIEATRPREPAAPSSDPQARDERAKPNEEIAR